MCFDSEVLEKRSSARYLGNKFRISILEAGSHFSVPGP
jgi:hypothetical protein